MHSVLKAKAGNAFANNSVRLKALKIRRTTSGFGTGIPVAFDASLIISNLKSDYKLKVQNNKNGIPKDFTEI